MTLQYLDMIIALSVVFLGLSLLITIFNQMISTLLSYRGTNLLWGLETMLSTLDPALAGKAKEIAETVLTQPMISDSLFSRFKDVPFFKNISSRWRLASAMSAQDLIHGLRQYADGLRVQSPPDATAMALHSALAAIDPEVARKAQMIESLVDQVSSDTVDKADALLKQLDASAQKAVGKVEVWFNRIMERASQRFALQMRIWTIVFAIALAFGAHINTFKVWQDLWSSPEIRNNLVSGREALTQEAAAVLATESDTPNPGAAVPPATVNSAMKTLRSQYKDAAALPAPPDFNSLTDAIDWLNKNADASHKDTLVAEYQKLVLKTLSAQANNIKQQITNSGLALIPSPYPGLFCFGGWKNFAGILVTAAFLSLGAPFWFNALKTLSNLRPMVANKQDAPKPSS